MPFHEKIQGCLGWPGEVSSSGNNSHSSLVLPKTRVIEIWPFTLCSVFLQYFSMLWHVQCTAKIEVADFSLQAFEILFFPYMHVKALFFPQIIKTLLSLIHKINSMHLNVKQLLKILSVLKKLQWKLLQLLQTDFFFLFLQIVSIEYKIQSYRDKLNRGILTV